MAPRELVFMNYNAGFWLGAVKVKKEDIEVGDVLILGDCRRSGCYPEVVEVRVISVNLDETVTVILRGGGVESVRLNNLRRPDWWTTPQFWSSQSPRTIPRFRRPTYKDKMLKHGVAVTGDRGIDDGHRDVMFHDYVASMESAG